ncbi:hypothetical protein PB2503_11714 [Parvularcula bermudensis HTCC2503]|uniref:Sulfatase-modifying factor enzyme-like domain-containing protein n=1 Tax=Parvularcula bermudensis (strain ATCC BAA-594 / HTCC2503 / KCTC 12087) TaxID=314260 RepID=E0TDG1_PARBH|nr:SUMF1/EgtB/PvdO family nonheme iron enzyme [Parvularcula bermudensis]ADM10387.1 hypothetical protein PB2503_11714 [Parvularcula bermudensis HTCC2503]
MNRRTGLLIGGAGLLAVAAITFWPRVMPPSPPSCLTSNELGGFIEVPGGGFVKAADPVYPEEGRPERVFVSPFELQVHEVTNSQFARFVEATGYITDAERNGGSAQFRTTVTPQNPMSWWRLDPEASWRTPGGEGSTLDGLALHPVVHISLADAHAYAEWVGGRLPTEVEWEYAASLGLFDPNDPDSGMRGPNGEARANVWTGIFPLINSAEDGFIGTAPVGCYRPGRIGAYDMIGNVWEWTDSPFAAGTPRFTIKGGSFLCSKNYCRRYRAAAREAFEPDFSTAHLGFRIVRDRPLDSDRAGLVVGQ